ncbi:MAG: hypothetical protein AAGG75_10660 [Bacteroidota bacterium]
MDTIAFDLSESRIGDHLTTNIYINNTDLRSIISAIEFRQLAGTKTAFINGAYEGISPFIAFHLHDHFYKKTINEYRYFDNRFAVYDYMYSGIPGDYTLACRIEINKHYVRWYDFKNFSELCPQNFDYGDLHFTFDALDYQQAISNLKKTKIQEIYA